MLRIMYYTMYVIIYDITSYSTVYEDAVTYIAAP